MPFGYRLLAYVGALVVAFSAGAYSHFRWTEARAVKAALKASEQAREIEHANAVSAIRRMDSYSVTAARNQARALPARSDLERVQHSIAAIAAAPAASACGPDPRLARVLDLLGEGAGLVEESARHIEELRAKRDALKE